MRIEDNRKAEQVTVDELLAGECFEYEGRFYLKVSKTASYPRNRAVNMSYGDVEEFYYNVIVKRVYAKLVVE